MKPASPIALWAVVRVGRRSEWILYPTISRTRRGAWTEYLSWFTDTKPAVEDLRSGELRLAKVTVSLT